jgi:membrane fusion protein (multidrug efflux system)
MMKMQQVALTLLISITFLTIAGCTGNSKNDGQVKAPINVRVERARMADGTHAIAYSGTLEESETIPLTFPVVGSVSRVLVSEGDAVKKGELLATVNPESFRNVYEMSLASEKQAEDSYKRLQPMYKNGNLPEVKLVEVETGLAKAHSATVIARKNLDDCRLLSPVDGLVGRRTIEPGMTTLPNVTSLTIVKIGKVFARVPVSENEIASIRKGQKAKITIAALNNAVFHGTVEEIGVLADPLAHTYMIKIGIVNRDLSIRSGMICTVLIPQSAAIGGVTVPCAAVTVDEGGRNFVYTVDSSRGFATRRFVTPGALLTDGMQIAAGLQADELVVVSGQHKLVDGAAVHIVNR